MKAEERHRLQQNELRLWAARAEDYWKLYGSYALVGLLVVVLIVAVSIYLTKRSDAAAAAEWEALRAATNAEQYTNVAEDYPGTVVAAWARLNAAQWSLRNGIELAFLDRAGAHDELTAARDSFKKALESNAATPEIREQALFGLAKTLETLAGIKNPEKPEAGPVASVDEALKAYQALLEQFPNSIYKPMAEERIASLKKPSAKEFYAWFADQTPRPQDRAMPRDPIHQGLTPPGMPALPPITGPTLQRDMTPGDQPPPPVSDARLPPPGPQSVPFADPRRFPGPLDEPVEAPIPPRAP